MRSLILPLFLVVAIALGAFGQISLKVGMRHAHITGIPALVQAIFTPYVLLGLSLYALSTCFWLTVISKWQLSYAYPMIAMGYVAVVFLSLFLFKERVLPLQWLGIALMVGGLILVVTFGSSTGQTAEATPTAAVQQTAPTR